MFSSAPISTKNWMCSSEKGSISHDEKSSPSPSELKKPPQRSPPDHSTKRKESVLRVQEGQIRRRVHFCGVSVNGFHPQLNPFSNPLLPASVNIPCGLPEGISIESEKEEEKRAPLHSIERDEELASNVSEMVVNLRANSGVTNGWKDTLRKKFEQLKRNEEYVNRVIDTQGRKQKSVASTHSSGMYRLRKSSKRKASSRPHRERFEKDGRKKRAIFYHTNDGEAGRCNETHTTVRSACKGKSGGDILIPKTTKGDSLVRNGQRAMSFKQDLPLCPNFLFDFDAVFRKSDIPQIIANSSGCIIAWNEAFLTTTGFSKDKLEQLNMFSIVRIDKLPSLFDVFARSLQAQPYSSSHDSLNGVRTEIPNPTPDPVDDKGYSWVATFPCTSFPARSNSHAHPIRPLYITITLMHDYEPRRRCFHCVLSKFAPTLGGQFRLNTETLRQLFTCDNPLNSACHYSTER